MTKIFLPVVLFISLGGCQAAKPQEKNDAAGTTSAPWWEKILATKNRTLELGQTRKVPPGATPELILRKNQLSYNGRPLTLGSSLDAWRQVLGPETACDGDYSKYGIHCWNNLGIWVHTSREHGNRVDLLEVFFNQKPDPFSDYGPGISPFDGKPVAPGINNYHNHLFDGYLELDGAGVDAKTRVWEVADLASGQYTYLCIREIRSCIIGPADQKYSMGFATDDGLAKGVIYELQIGLRDD